MNTEDRFTWRTVSQSVVGNWSAGCRRWMPPQFRRMWILVPEARMEGVRAETEDGEERSQG